MSSEGEGEQDGQALVPKLRFPEFREPWSHVAMSEAYQFKGNNSLSRDQLNYESGDFRNIHYGDIHTRFASHFYVHKERVPYVSSGQSHTTIRQENYCRPGDVIFADASEDVNDIGKAIEIIDAGEVPLVAGLHTILARPSKELIAPGFGGYLFQSSGARRQIQRESQGAKVLGLSPTRLREIKLSLPNDKAEQQKIAKCLSSLDAVIVAEGERLAALKAHKKGLIQALFPAPGQTIPRLRFPEFEGKVEWEEKSLGKICRPQQWATISSADLAETGYPVYGANGWIGYYAQYNHEFETVAVTCRGSTCGEVTIIPPNSYITGNSMCLDEIDPKSDDYRFIYQLLRHRGFNDIISGSAQPQIVGSAIKTLPVVLPDLSEQQRIADCLTSLDSYCTAQSDKVAALKCYRAALMQQLFPAPEVSA